MLEKLCVERAQARGARRRRMSSARRVGDSAARIEARSRTCASSRTLPGQSWAQSLSSAAAERLLRGAVAAHERKEMLAQRGDIGEALAQWRNVDRKDSQAVIEIQAKVARSGSCFEILVRGSDYPHVHSHGVVVPDALDLAILQKAQHLGLETDGHLANLVEKKRAAMRCFDAAGARLDSAGEGSASVAEELGLEQGFGDGRAVEHHEGLGRTRAQTM